MMETELPVEEYRLSAQQSTTHLAAPYGMSPSTVVLLEGPEGSIDIERLRTALEQAASRHEILRTRYRVVAHVRYPVQCVLTQLAPVWQMIDGSADDADLIAAARDLIDIYDGAVLASVVSIANGRIRWSLAAAQHSLDLFSVQALVIACLNAASSDTAMVAGTDEPLQYADYTAWQEELFGSELGREGAQFWETKLLEALAPAGLPFRQSAPTTDQVVAIESALPSAEALAELAARCGTSIQSMLQSMWAGYLARLNHSDVLAFSMAWEGRSPELDGAIGNYAAVLPVLVRLNDRASTEQHIASVVRQLGEFAEWSECFDTGHHHERMARDGIAAGLLTYEHVELRPLLDEWIWRDVDIEPSSAWLKCLCVEQEAGLRMKWVSNGYFAPEALQVFGRQFAAFLESAISNPHRLWHDLPLLGEAEQQEVLTMAGVGANQTKLRPRELRLHELFELASARYSERPAVVGEGKCFSYRELEAYANYLAQQLCSAGARPGVIVGISIGRSVYAVAAMLAVLKVGAAYVPIDPDYPEERVAFMLRDAGISIVVTLSADTEGLSGEGRPVIAADDVVPEGECKRLSVEVPPDALAYLIYTSGSTGQPKGVMVTHRNVVTSTLARAEFYPESVQNYLLLSSFSFDSSVAGIFWTLMQGGTFHLPIQGEHYDPEQLARKIEEQAISHVLTLPSFYQQILQYLRNPVSLRCCIVAGESCHSEVVAKHRQYVPSAELVNEYGPTESTVWSNAFRIGPEKVVEDGVPIGRPILGMRALILDSDLNLCPIGQAGELLVGGAGVTRGYLHQSGITAQRYVADPLGSGERLYRTGDLVRYRPDGEIDYLGRVDRQVKLRGHRVELDEIESCLLQHPSVCEAAVLLQDDVTEGARIIAHVSLLLETDLEKTDATGEAILAFASNRLPAIMVPAAISVSDKIPKLPNGKIDRHALCAFTSTYHRPRFVAPTTSVERRLANIWKTVLKVEQVGLDDDFFALGGHSMLTTQVVAKIRRELSIDLPIQDVFTSTRLRDLVEKVSEDTDNLTRDLALLESTSAEVETK